MRLRNASGKQHLHRWQDPVAYATDDGLDQGKLLVAASIRRTEGTQREPEMRIEVRSISLLSTRDEFISI
jgi:hypothetical protein